MDNANEKNCGSFHDVTCSICCESVLSCEVKSKNARSYFLAPPFRRLHGRLAGFLCRVACRLANHFHLIDIGHELPVQLPADRLPGERVAIHNRVDVGRGSLATIGQDLVELDDPGVLFLRPCALAEPAVGIEHPGADRACRRVPANDLRAFEDVVRSGLRDLEGISQERLVLRPGYGGRVVHFGTVVDPIADEPGQFLQLGTRRLRFGNVGFTNRIELPSAALLHVDREIGRVAWRFRRANDANRAFLDGHLGRHHANGRVDDLDAHALVLAEQSLHLLLDGLPSLEPLAGRADPLAGFAPMRGHGFGVAAVVGGNVGVDRRPDRRLLGPRRRLLRLRRRADVQKKGRRHKQRQTNAAVRGMGLTKVRCMIVLSCGIS